MNIRIMTETDLDQVSDLFIQQAAHVKNLDDPYCDNEASIIHDDLHGRFSSYLTDLLASPDALIIVAEDGLRIVGFIIGEITPCRVPSFISKVEKVGYIDEAHVLPEYRRKGLLTQMEASLFNFFRAQQVGYVELNYFTANGVAKDSWTALGYRPYMEYARKRIDG